MKKIYFLLLTILFAAVSNAQLTGTKTIPGDYASIAAAVADLNTLGVGAGGVVFNVAAGNSETAPVGGINLTATGTAANPITFQKSGAGANPLIIAAVGTVTLTTTSAAVDGIFSFNGSDYVTMDGIDLIDNNASGAAMMEFGYGFFKASATNGCQNNTIKNCVVTLNKANNIAGTTTTFENGCKGIYLGNVTIAAMATDLVVTAASGQNSGNTFTGNMIQNCFEGIYMRGYGDGVSPYTYLDQNNTIGGISAGLGNTIRNFGTGTNTTFGIITVNQNNLLVQYNNINNTAGGGTTHGGSLVGMSITGSFTINNSNYNIRNNTVTLGQGTNTSQTQGLSIGTAGGTGTVTISDNLFTGFTNTSGATAGAVFATVVSNAAGATLNITNNTYSNNQISGIVNMISLQGTATAATANITGNTFSNNTISNNVTGTTILISNGAAVTGALNINNNVINGLNFVSAMSNTAALIFNAAGPATLAYTATGNNIQNITYPAGFTSTLYLMYCATGTPASANMSSNTISNISMNSVTSATIYGIYNASAMVTYTASNNIFSNISTSATGTTACIYNSATISGTATVNNNSVTNINRSGASGTHYTVYTGSPAVGTYDGNTIDGITFSTVSSTGTIYGIYDISSGLKMTYSNNIVRNLSTPTSGALFGIRDFGSAGIKNIVNNQVYNFSTTVGGIGGASMTGLSIATGTTDTIRGNTVYSLNNTGTTGGASSTVIGILASSGTTNYIYKNKVYDLSSTSANGIVWGIQISGGTTNNVYNNVIGDLRLPAVNAAINLAGINLSGGTTDNAYYNTVNLNATSTGALFGSTAIYVSTTPTVTLRNNIFVNNSTANGATGFTTAYRRTSTTLTTYGATSNNNLFFAGATCSSRLIYYDGTNADQTLTAYKTRVSARDAASVTEDPKFVSTVGSAATFLHINTGIATQIESGAATIAGFTDDFDGDVRNVTTPDIGADEFTGIAAAACSGTPTAGTITPASVTICAGLSTTLCLSGQSAASGISIQWQSSATSGGPYTSIPCAGSTCYNTGVLTAGTYYYVALVTCSASGLTATSNQVTVTVNPPPSITLTPSSASICAGAAGVSLTASGPSVSYTWSPATGLSATTGATVTATPTVTTTYTVTGTDAIGCTNTGTVTVTVYAKPTITATATPAVVCSGANSQLLATGVQNFTTPQAASYVYSTASGTTLQNMAGAINLIGTGADVSASAVTNIGFGFNFGGVNYTQFSVSSNGAMGFGSVAVTSADGNNSTTVPSVAGAWDDMHTGTDGNVRYVLNSAGGVGNRILVAEWNYRNYGESAPGTFTKTVQVWLYEGTNQIKFVYGPNTGVPLASATVGIVSGAGNFNDVNTTTNANNIVTAQDANTVWPALGTTFIFTPTNPTAFTYLWTPSTFLSATNIANPVATAVTATTTYNVTATGAGSCVSDPAIVVVSLPTAMTAAVNSPARCSADVTTAITGVPTGGAPSFTYAWTPITDLYTDAAGTLAYAGGYISSATIYTKAPASTSYNLSIKDNCGTTASAVSTVTFTSNPTATASSNSPVCTGSTLSLTGTTTGTSFAWTGPNSFVSALQNPTIPAVTAAAAGTYNFIASTNGCASASSATTVVVNIAPTVTSTAASSTLICNGTSINLTSSAVSNIPTNLISEGFEGGALPAGWASINNGTGNLWTIPSSLNGTAHTGSKAAEYLYNLSQAGTAYLITSGLSLTGGVTYTISSWYKSSGATFPEKLKITVGTAQTVAAQSTVVQDIGTVSSSTYAQQTATYTPVSSGTYYFAWNAYSLANEFYLDVDDILISQPAVAPTYAWTSVPVGFTSSLQNPTGVTPTVTTTYTVTATNPSAGACTATGNVTVTVNQQSGNPTSAVAGAATICNGSSTTLTLVGGGGGTGEVIKWYTASCGGTLAATGNGVSVSPTTTTTYYGRYEDGAPCSFNSACASVTVTVNQQSADPSSVTATSTTLCNGGSTTLTLNGGGGGTSEVINWYTGSCGGTLVGTGNGLVVSPTITTTYYARYEDGTPCNYNSACASVTITVNQLPIISSSSTQPTTCVSIDGAISLTITGAAGPYSYAWTGPGVNATAQNQTGLTVGTYDVTVTVIATGCSASATINLSGPGGCAVCPTIPTLTTTPSGSTCAGTTVGINVTGMTNIGISYGVTFKHSTSPLADPYTGGTIIATVPNGGLTAGGTAASTSNLFATAGTYYIYAILSPTPIDPLCRPSNMATLVVVPVADVNTVANQVICNNAATTAVNFTGTVPGTVFNWTNNTTSIGLAASGTGNIASFNATNATSAPVVATVTVTPSYTGFVAGTQTFNYTGALQTWTVPAGVTSITINGYGAEGGIGSIGGNGAIGGLGGKGTHVSGTLTVTPGQILNLYVGGAGATGTGGYNGGGTGGNALAGGGGGASDVRYPGITTANRILVAAGGGGGGRGGCESGTISGGTGGDGDGNGNNGTNSSNGGGGFGAIGSSFGGAGIGCGGFLGAPGAAGDALGVGGNGGNGQACCCYTAGSIPGGGGGGGGFLGGGGGGGGSAGTVGCGGNDKGGGGGGAGGSSYTGGVSGGTTSTGIQTGNGQIVITYNVPAVTCTGTPKTFTYTVNPTATVNVVANQVVCNNAATTAVSFSSPTTGGTIVYNWTNNTTSIGLAASGAGNIASFTATNATTAPVTATITVTPSYTNAGTTCVGTPRTFTITVNPTATVNAVANQVVCNNASTTTVNFGSPTTGGTIVYNWTNNTASIGLAASGTGNIASFTAVNATTAPVTATITVTPSYTNGGVTCVGTARTFTITVNPTATVTQPTNQTVCNGGTTTAVNFSSPTTGGTIVYNWTNNTTSIGLAASGTGNIAAFTATNATILTVIATITVTPSYTNGGVTCVGTPTTFTITVYPTPIVNPPLPANQVYCNGSTVPQVTLTGPAPGTYYTWTNSQPSIGLAALGAGDIPSFTATNTGAAPVTATITITPHIGASCVGAPISYTITVNPTPAVTPIVNQVLCNGATTAAVTITGPVTGTVYTWTNSTTSIGLAASGTGNIAAFTAVNLGSAPVTATITVTPTFTNAGTTCTGTPVTFTITVNPTSTVNGVSNQTLCNGASTTAITFTGAVTGTTYNWTNSTASIGLAASGSGNIGSFVATNAGAVAVTATITVTPVAAGCTGTATSFTITVNPTATVNAVANQTLCTGLATAPIAFSGTVAGTVYNWTNNTPSIGLAASGTGNIASFIASNTTTSVITATITVTPTTAAGCTGTPRTFTITVNPAVYITTLVAPDVCMTDTIITLNATPAGVWSGRGVIPGTNKFDPTLAGFGVSTLTYTVTTGCGAVANVSINVKDCLERHNVLANSIRIWPNPSSGKFNIKFLSDKYKEFGLKVVDAAGKTMRDLQFTNLIYGSIIPMDLRALPSGMYVLLAYNSQEHASFQIIIAH